MMKNPILSLTAAALLAAPLAGLAPQAGSAQENEPQDVKPLPAETVPQDGETATGNAPAASRQTPFIQELPSSALTAQQLIDSKVLDVKGEQIGRVADVILDQDGKLAGIVLETGGFLGIGAKRLGLRSINLPRPSSDGKLHSGLTKEQIAQAPAFEGGEAGIGEKLMKSIEPDGGSNQSR